MLTRRSPVITARQRAGRDLAFRQKAEFGSGAKGGLRLSALVVFRVSFHFLALVDDP